MIRRNTYDMFDEGNDLMEIIDSDYHMNKDYDESDTADDDMDEKLEEDQNDVDADEDDESDETDYETDFNRTLSAVDETNRPPKDEDGKYILTDEEIANYKMLISKLCADPRLTKLGQKFLDENMLEMIHICVNSSNKELFDGAISLVWLGLHPYVKRRAKHFLGDKSMYYNHYEDFIQDSYETEVGFMPLYDPRRGINISNFGEKYFNAGFISLRAQCVGSALPTKYYHHMNTKVKRMIDKLAKKNIDNPTPKQISDALRLEGQNVSVITVTKVLEMNVKQCNLDAVGDIKDENIYSNPEKLMEKSERQKAFYENIKGMGKTQQQIVNILVELMDADDSDKLPTNEAIKQAYVKKNASDIDIDFTNENEVKRFMNWLDKHIDQALQYLRYTHRKSSSIGYGNPTSKALLSSSHPSGISFEEEEYIDMEMDDIQNAAIENPEYILDL